MRGFLVVTLVSVGVLASAFGESTVLLKSGEILQGDIISDTNGVLQIAAHNATRTISYQRTIPHSDIQSVQTETTAQAAERTDYEALSQFQLNPNQEQSADYCGQVIAVFRKFLISYPGSTNAPAVQQRLDTWQAELRHVSDGEVKFGDKWMTPEDKKPLVVHWQKQMKVQSAQNTLAALKRKLQDLQRQRDSLTENIATAQGNLTAAQQQLGGLQDSQVPTVQNVAIPNQQRRGQSRPDVSYTQVPGDSTTVPNPERGGLQDNVAMYQGQLSTGQQELDTLDAKIQAVQVQIAKGEQDYKIALVQLNPPPPPPPLPIVTQVVVKVEPPPPQPAAVADPVPTPKDVSWLTKHFWDWIAVCAVLILGFFYILKRNTTDTL